MLHTQESWDHSCLFRSLAVCELLCRAIQWEGEVELGVLISSHRSEETNSEIFMVIDPRQTQLVELLIVLLRNHPEKLLGLITNYLPGELSPSYS